MDRKGSVVGEALGRNPGCFLTVSFLTLICRCDGQSRMVFKGAFCGKGGHGGHISPPVFHGEIDRQASRSGNSNAALVGKGAYFRCAIFPAGDVNRVLSFQRNSEQLICVAHIKKHGI